MERREDEIEEGKGEGRVRGEEKRSKLDRDEDHMLRFGL